MVTKTELFESTNKNEMQMIMESEIIYCYFYFNLTLE